MTGCRICILLYALASAWSTVALAEEPQAPLPGASSPAEVSAAAVDPCAPKHWSLRGAAAQPGSGEEAIFDRAWEAPLAEAAACLRSEQGRFACLEVEGRFDETAFSQPIITAFGSVSGAQNARARARANGVLSRLSAHGVPASQLREVHPRLTPTWRGVELSLVADCLARPAPALSPEEHAAVVEVRQLVSGGALQRALEVRETPAPAGPPLLAGLWIEGGATGSLGLAAPGAALGPGLRLGAGLGRADWYGRLSTAGALVVREAQRTSFELAAGGGRALLPWLSVGLQAGVRTGAPAPQLPWLEQGWFLAVESRQCLLRLGEDTRLCLEEALGAGLQLQRGVVTDGRIERVLPANDLLLRAELSVLVQHDLL